MKNKYPIYVISKGRPNTCLTARELISMGVSFTLVVEPQELDLYNHITDDILVTPFSNLGQGSIPVRNFVWEHSILNGNERHWILDDNIEEFVRLNRNEKYKLLSPLFFVCMENFVDRYENVAIAGANYTGLVRATSCVPAFYLNTRIYSCILIKNDLPFRWRGLYNEDTDLSLRVLKEGWCTILFNAFLAGKVTTLRMRGGNTSEVYGDTDNRWEFAESLRQQHPDVVKVTQKWNRWHHHVNYKPFKKNKLILKQNTEIKNQINEFGMQLVSLEDYISQK